MLFNSYVFVLLFLPLVLAGWWFLPRGGNLRLGVLVAASYAFYGWWDWRFVGLLALSTVVDYWAGGRLYRCLPSRRDRRLAGGPEEAGGMRPEAAGVPPRLEEGWSGQAYGTQAESVPAPYQKTGCGGSWVGRISASPATYLGLSLASNLGMLAAFKYSGFFAASVNAVIDWMRFGGALPVPEIVLPVGISFYTFQTMSYTIDLYRGDARPARGLLHFAAYVSMFPQLIAGPIVRYRDLEAQLRELGKPPRAENFARGIWFFVMGMAQKILLADSIAKLINPMLVDFAELQFFGAWFAMLGYTCQLYFDFAGYSNMAVGLGWMLGFSFPQNFDSPYRAENIAVFWRRWHMTLSFWLRDYLFIPLGGSRVGRLLSLRNLMLVMLLGGLWHGAAWTFVLWGAYHGALLALHRGWRSAVNALPGWKSGDMFPIAGSGLARRLGEASGRAHRIGGLLGPFARPGISLPAVCSAGGTFVAVVFGWVLFRAENLAMAGQLAGAMVGMQGWEASPLAAAGGVKGAGILAVLLGVVFLAPNVWRIAWKPNLITAVGLAGVFVLCVLRFDAESPFLYFQF